MSPNDPCTLVDNAHDLAEALEGRQSVVALFYASWCPFCIRFLPAFEQQAKGKPGHFIIVQDDAEAMADQFAVEVYPTVLFIEKGAVSKRLDGVPGIGLDEKKLAGFLASCPVS